MHQPINWWRGLVPLALLWAIANLVHTGAVEADLAHRAGAAIAGISADLPGKPTVSVAGRDVTLSDLGFTQQASVRADATFGVRKVIEETAPRPPSTAPLNVSACQSEFAAVLSKDMIRFATGSADLDSASTPVLTQVVAVAKRCTSGAIAVAGHTDSSGDATYNMTLSKMRAQAVVDYLVKNGIDPTRISAVGYGDTRPIAANNTDAGKAQNRRIEFTVK
jgi:outer membrane protein OmpA-like peptidoglycan-associated protein